MDEARTVRRRRIVVDMQDIVLNIVEIGVMRYQDRYDGDDICGGCRSCEDVMVMTRFASLPGFFYSIDRALGYLEGRLRFVDGKE